MTTITVDLSTFKSLFPALGDVTQEQLNSAYAGAGAYISTELGSIVLPANLQTRGVYLACAHRVYLMQNPDIATQGKVASATEGSVSASFTQPQYKNWLEYELSLSPYGLELLAILSQVQPPIARKPLNTYPYYSGGWWCV